MRRGWDRAAGGPRCADRATHAGRALGMDGDSFSTTVKVSSAPVTAVTSATDRGSVSQAAVPTTTPGLRTLHRALPAHPVLSHVLGGGPLGRVSVSAFLSPRWGLPAGRGGAQEESELEGTPKAMARSGEVWISGGGSRRLWGHSPRWQHRPEHGAAGSHPGGPPLSSGLTWSTGAKGAGGGPDSSQHGGPGGLASWGGRQQLARGTPSSAPRAQFSEPGPKGGRTLTGHIPPGLSGRLSRPLPHPAAGWRRRVCPSRARDGGFREADKEPSTRGCRAGLCARPYRTGVKRSA